MAETFSTFKTQFYSKVPDLALFDCEDFNLLKVVLDGLKVNYAKRGIVNQEIFQNTFSFHLKRIVRRIKHHSAVRLGRSTYADLQKKINAPYLLFDNGRIAQDTDGKEVSFYFNRIEKFLGKEKCVTIYQAKTRLDQGPDIHKLSFVNLYDPYSKEEKEFIIRLKSSYRNIENEGIFSNEELLNIRVAINKFFHEYRTWKYILENGKVKYALFDEHYHREGFILALKRKGIKVVELQHGLIAREDIFYVFPPQVKSVAKKALFPDKLFTYGEYWSRILAEGSEFDKNQVEVLGLYQEINTNVSPEHLKQLNDFLKGELFVLVTTQTFLHKYFIEYIEWLSEDLKKNSSNVKIVVKMHPSEKMENYKELDRLNNVTIINCNTEYLLSKCQWHISSYSTTLYDATKYSCTNFSIYIEQSKDYIESFVKEGISVLIKKGENPVLRSVKAEETRKFTRADIFADFNEHKHKLMQLDLN
jgi:hypothetical protein